MHISVLQAIIITLAILFIVFGAITLLDWWKYLGVVPGTAKSDVTKPSTYVAFPSELMEEWDPMSYLLERDAGSTTVEMTEYLQSKPISYDCTGCTNCNGDACSSCSQCGGRTGIFNNCLICSSGSCVGCDNINSEPELCKIIKGCVRAAEAFGDEPCDVTELYRATGHAFDLNGFENILRQCEPEMLKLDMGEESIQQLCRFDTYDISTASLTNPPQFYYSESHCKKNFLGSSITDPSCTPVTPGVDAGNLFFNIMAPWAALLSGNGLKFSVDFGLDSVQPIYTRDEYGQLVENLGVWVASKAMIPANKEIDVPVYAIIEGGSKAGSQKIGSVHFSNTGSSKAGILVTTWIPFPDDWLQQGDADLYNLKGLVVDFNFISTTDSTVMDFTSIEIRNRVPSSQTSYTNDIRYSRCNYRLPDALGNVISKPYIVYDDWSPSGNLDSTMRGNIRITVSDIRTAPQERCTFAVDVCSQDAFLENTDDALGKVVEELSNWNTQDAHRTWYNTISNAQLYNYYEFNLDKAYTPEEVIAAIKTGIFKWEVYNAPFIAFPEGVAETDNSGPNILPWNTIQDNGLKYERDPILITQGDCWYPNLFSPTPSQPTLRYNCPGGTCTGKLKMRISWFYHPITTTSAFLKQMTPLITFCSSG